MMQAFRNSAKPLIFIVAISFFAWLVLDLSGLTGGTGFTTRTSVGKVNGRSIDVRVFQQAVNNATEARQRQSSEPLGIAELAQIRDQVWEQFIQERLLEDEYRRFGISASPQEIAAAIRVSPPPEIMSAPTFQTDGQFDPGKYERWLASSEGQGFIPLLEEQYRSQLMQAKLARHLVASVSVSDPELWERYKDQREQVRVGAVMVDASAVTDSAPVTPTEAQEYYRANRESFRREAMVWLSYLEVDRRPIASDTAAARVRAESLRAEILGGTPFAEVAARESADTISGQNGGDLGAWTSGSYDPGFESAVAGLPLNRVSEPILTRFGFHVVEITRRNRDTTAGRHILIPVEVTGEHRERLDARADSLESLAAEQMDREGLDQAAQAMGLTIRQAGPFAQGMGSALPADAMVWAFQAVEDEHSPVIEDRNAYYVFRVDSTRAAGIPPFEAVRAEVEAQVRDRRLKAKAKELADAVAERATSSTLEAAATSLGLSYRILGPISRVTAPFNGGAVVGAAFALAPGQRSRPIEGADAWYLLEGVERIPADSAAFATELPQLRQQALNTARSIYLRQYLSTLRERARIVDDRGEIFKTAAQIEAEAPVLPGTGASR